MEANCFTLHVTGLVPPWVSVAYLVYFMKLEILKVSPDKPLHHIRGKYTSPAECPWVIFSLVLVLQKKPE